MPKESYHITPGSEEHRKRITASKIASILQTADGRSLSKFENRAELWLRMRGDVPPQESTPPMRRGHNQEASILAWYFDEVRPDLTKTSGETTFTRPDLPWAAANPDAVADEKGRTVFIDAKSIAHDGGEWGEPGTDAAPASYVTQMLWAMHMTHGDGGLHVTRSYLIKHGPFVDQYDEYFVDYDPALAQWIEDECRAFWLSLTDDDACPIPTPLAGVHKTFAKLHSGIQPDTFWQINATTAREYLQAKEDRKDAQAREDAAKAEILRCMGDAHTAMCGDVKLGYRRKTKTGISFYPPARPPHIEDLPDTHTQAAA